MISRRDFFKSGVAALAAARLAYPWLSWAAEGGLAVPGEEGMILRSFRFLDLEMPMEYLDSWITPVPHFFVRNHLNEPSTLDAEDWRLSIGGEVEKPLTLRMADLQKFPAHTITNTLECAGNGRAFQRPQVPGVQWQRGAVGTARFSGPRLRDVLQAAGVKATGKHVMFHGLDEVPGKVPPFIRSIPIEKALDGDTLIAMEMNGAPLTKHHGFPARAVVPGWIGAASCKWLSEIKVLDQEFDGNFMNPGYRMPNQAIKPGDAVKPEETHAITELEVKSVIAAPVEGAVVKGGRLEIRGAAWGGEADIQQVQVSTDAGATWGAAQLGPEQAHYAWRLWRYTWKPAKSGDYVIKSRATDSRGRTQPAQAFWNPSGYLYNAVDQVKVHVA